MVIRFYLKKYFDYSLSYSINIVNYLKMANHNLIKPEGKMFRTYALILILSMGFVFHGCTAFKFLDGSSGEEIETFKMNKREMSVELNNLKSENEKLQRQIDITNEQNQRFKVESGQKYAQAIEQNHTLSQENNKLKEDNRRITEENENLKKKPAETQAKAKTSAPAPSHKAAKGTGGLKIKILSGDGNFNSAKEMAKKLRKSGYTIQLVDQAHRSDFKKTTIYFAPKFKYEAKRLASKLDGNPALQSLSWPSKFNLIIVTGAMQ